MASREKEQTEVKNEVNKPYRFFLNGEPVERLPQEALDAMSKRLSRVVSEYFTQHPDEYQLFLKECEERCLTAPN